MTAPHLELVPTIGLRLGEVYRDPGGSLAVEIDDHVIYITTTTFRGGPTWRGFRVACRRAIGREPNAVPKREWALIVEARLARIRPWSEWEARVERAGRKP